MNIQAKNKQTNAAINNADHNHELSLKAYINLHSMLKIVEYNLLFVRVVMYYLG